MSVVPQDSNDENENHVEPLDAVDLKCCGEILFELFTQFKNSAAEDDGSDCSLSSNSYCSIGEHLLRQRFDGLYDLMSHDLVGVDECYRTLPKHRLYVELDDFTKYVPLHEMNRYVFGDETYRPKDFSKPKDKRALEVVRTWRKKFENKITRVGVPDSLIETYKTAADNGELSVRDLAMVAFAAFNFLTGYDTMVDLKNAFIFNHIRALHEQPSFKQVYNRGSRNARIFLHENDPVNDWEYFEIFVANPLTVDLLKWIYDLLIKRPDAVEQFTRNPFSDEPDVLGEMCDVIGRKVKSSYLMALRIFYKWASRELFMVLSGEIHDRLSLLDNHIKQNLSLNTSWTQLFDDCYRYVLEYFTKILQHYNCPADILETFHVTGQYELFRELVRFCVQVLVDTNSFLGYRESSTSSNESTTDFSSASCSSQA